MRLLVDAGNTRIKWAIAGNDADKVLMNGVVSDDWSEISEFEGEIETAWVSCVASDDVLGGVCLDIKRLLGIEASVVEVSSSVAGMTNGYDDLSQLGVDRWVAALGARSLVAKGALIVIDAGTAVTIDMVSIENCFEGGVILPGFATMHDSLLGRTAGIQSDRLGVNSVIGKNTQECVNAGVEYGLIGAVDRVIAEMRRERRGVNPRLLAMGGDANAIVAGSEFKVELQSDMIFHGLMLLSTK